MGNYITRNLHQLTSNTDVINRNKQRRDKDFRQRICITDYSPNEYEELVFVQGSDYKLIYGQNDGDNKRSKWPPIVKITNPNNGKFVYRAFRTSSEIHGFRDYAAVSYTTIKQITTNKEELENLKYVVLSKGNIIPFYLNHPNHATRIGIYSACIGVLSLAISILSIILNT